MSSILPKQTFDDVPLGALVRDRVSGFEGIVEAHTLWLNGCMRVTVSPKVGKDGKIPGRESFDIEQIEVLKADAIAPKPKKRRTNGPMPTPTR